MTRDQPPLVHALVHAWPYRKPQDHSHSCPTNNRGQFARVEGQSLNNNGRGSSNHVATMYRGYDQRQRAFIIDTSIYGCMLVMLRRLLPFRGEYGGKLPEAVLERLTAQGVARPNELQRKVRDQICSWKYNKLCGVYRYFKLVLKHPQMFCIMLCRRHGHYPAGKRGIFLENFSRHSEI